MTGKQPTHTNREIATFFCVPIAAHIAMHHGLSSHSRAIAQENIAMQHLSIIRYDDAKAWIGARVCGKLTKSLTAP